jgi:DNA-binding NarL/FixJ family response regulator
MDSRQPPVQVRHVSAAIVSDDRLFRDVLTAALRRRHIDTLASEPEQWHQLPERAVVVVDVKESGQDELSGKVSYIRHFAPAARILLLGREPRRGLSTLAREVGAAGSATRKDSIDDFVRTVIEAANGSLCRPPVQRRPLTRSTTRPPALTSRELQVLELVASGSSDVCVAEELGISVHTVRSHLQSARNKLGAATRFAAVASIRSSGLLGGHPTDDELGVSSRGRSARGHAPPERRRPVSD